MHAVDISHFKGLSINTECIVGALIHLLHGRSAGTRRRQWRRAAAVSRCSSACTTAGSMVSTLSLPQGYHGSTLQRSILEELSASDAVCKMYAVMQK